MEFVNEYTPGTTSKQKRGDGQTGIRVYYISLDCMLYYVDEELETGSFCHYICLYTCLAEAI